MNLLTYNNFANWMLIGLIRAVVFILFMGVTWGGIALLYPDAVLLALLVFRLKYPHGKVINVSDKSLMIWEFVIVFFANMLTGYIASLITAYRQHRTRN